MWWNFIKFILRLSILAAFLMASRLVSACPLCPQEHLTSAGIEIKQSCIDLRGYQLYMQTAGDKGPYIIFESGLGDTLATWNKVVPQVAKFAHTIAYDRSGLGRSEINPNIHAPITAQQAVANLRTLLNKNGIFPPYILVGHSLGGLYMQLFAEEYPQEILGVVLVDSATRDQSGDEPLPPADANYYLEAKGMKESIAQVKKAGAFPDVPLTILTTAQRGKDWLRLQNGLTKLSPKSRQIITDKSGHHIASEEPALVISAITEIVDAVQKASPSSATNLSLVKQFVAARNNHDIDAALNLFADNIVWKTSWGDTLYGKAALKNMLADQFKDNIHNEIINTPQVVNNTVWLLRRASMDSWQKMGIDYLVEDAEVTINNNKIVAWKNQYTPDSASKLQKVKNHLR